MTSAVTRASTFADAGFSMVLPGTWAPIPVRDEKRAAHAVAALVKRQVGRDDRFATVRRNVREQLNDVVRRAREANANQLALSLEILPGVPFPASAVFTMRTWPGERPSPEQRGAAIAGMLPGGEPIDCDAGPTVRAWRQVRIRPGTETIEDTKLEYLIAAPGGDQVLHLVADAPVDCDPELIVALFDAMVDSIRWHTEPVQR